MGASLVDRWKQLDGADEAGGMHACAASSVQEHGRAACAGDRACANSADSGWLFLVEESPPAGQHGCLSSAVRVPQARQQVHAMMDAQL